MILMNTGIGALTVTIYSGKHPLSNALPVLVERFKKKKVHLR